MEVASQINDVGMEDDMDIDIDLGPDYVDIPQADITSTSPLDVQIQPGVTTSESLTLTSTLTSEESVPYKVHIRGVDDLTTNDIRSFAIEHYPLNPPTHIEWIDDTSANIVFETSEIASDALNSFTLHSNDDVATLHPLQPRTAKPLSTRPNSVLLVRIAVPSDRKRPRAHESSRFYLMHPEHDPRERRRQNSRTSGDYHRKRYGNREHRRRRKDDAAEGFTADMYDDNADALAARSGRRNSGASCSSHSSYSRHSDRRMERNGNGSRDRSASPGKETDNDRRRTRQRTPPPRYSVRDPNPFRKENITKELFPARLGFHDVSTLLRNKSPSTQELFPTKKATSNLKKELFPLKAGISVHRRSDAFDAADETADLFATGMTVPFVDGSSDRLSKRIGRLKESDPIIIPDDPDPAKIEDGGFSIRGAAKDQGFAIRGAASDATYSNRLKELFPSKAGGNDLFADRIRGRGLIRRTAADMFY